MTVAGFAVLLAVSAWLEGPQSVAAAKSKGTVLLVQEPGGSYSNTIRSVVESAGKGGFVPPPSLPLVDVIRELGCASLDAPCAAQIADTLDANAALLIDIRDDSSGVNASMHLVTKGGKSVRPVATFFVPTHNPARPIRDRMGRVGRALGVAASAYMRKLPMPALLWVESADGSVAITMDGKAMTTPADVVDLPAGKHSIVAGAITTEVELETGKVTIAWVQTATVVAPPAPVAVVVPVAPAATANAPGWAWPMVGGGIAAIIVGAVVGVVNSSLVMSSYGPEQQNGDPTYKDKDTNPLCTSVYGCGDGTASDNPWVGMGPHFIAAQVVGGLGYGVAGLGVAATATGLWATTWEE